MHFFVFFERSGVFHYDRSYALSYVFAQVSARLKMLVNLSP